MDFVSILSIFAPARFVGRQVVRSAARALPAAVAAGALVASGASAQAPTDERRYSAIWLIQGKPAPEGVQTIRKGGFVYLQRLLTY